MKQSGNRIRGYTLIEMAIVMSVTALLAAIGLPAFRSTLEQQHLSASMHQISAEFAAARNTALTLGESVSVCPSIDGAQCRSDSDWSKGWIMYRDRARESQPRDPSTVLRHENVPAAASMTLLSSSGRKAIRFLPDGRSAGSNLKIRICSHDRLLGEVVVNNVGRIRATRMRQTQPCEIERSTSA